MKSLPGVEEFLEGSPASIFETVIERCSAAMGSEVSMLLLDHLDLVDFYVIHGNRLIEVSSCGDLSLWRHVFRLKSCGCRVHSYRNELELHAR